MTIIEQNTCTVQRLNHQGLGVGQTDKGQVELPFTLPGEIVEFTRHHYRGKSNCTLDKMISPSPHRIIPTCQYFGRCGGCLLQHLDRPTYENFKTNLIKNELDKANINTNIKPLIIIDNDQRRRINLQFIKKKDQIYLGFYRYHSHQIINIDSCPAALKEISDLIIPFKRILFEILKFDHKGQMFITRATNGIEVMLEFADLTAIDQTKLINFTQNHNLIKLTIKDKVNEKVIYQYQIAYIEFASVQVEIDYASFLQASFAADHLLTDLIIRYLPQNNNKLEILDLFCGRGTFSFSLNKHGIVQGFEVDLVAVTAASNAATNEKLTSVNFLPRNLFNNPLQKAELANYDVAVINPPRKGASEQCFYLARSSIAIVVYVSCNVQSFIKDADILIKGNYKLIEITPIDQFYWTPHLEIVAFFKKC